MARDQLQSQRKCSAKCSADFVDLLRVQKCKSNAARFSFLENKAEELKSTLLKYDLLIVLEK